MVPVIYIQIKFSIFSTRVGVSSRLTLMLTSIRVSLINRLVGIVDSVALKSC